MKEMEIEKRYSPQTESFYRRRIQPEEEKAEPTSPGCGYRWFRSENIIPIEHYQRPQLSTPAQVKPCIG
jgi:hypothetical protein